MNLDNDRDLNELCKWLKKTKGITQINILDLIDYIPEYERSLAGPDISMLEIISASCDKHGVSFSGFESNAIIDAMRAYAKIYLQMWKKFNDYEES